MATVSQRAVSRAPTWGVNGSTTAPVGSIYRPDISDTAAFRFDGCDWRSGSRSVSATCETALTDLRECEDLSHVRIFHTERRIVIPAVYLASEDIHCDILL